MSNILLITVPNNKESAATTFSGIAHQVDLKGGRMNRFETPSLVVGTLDSLMALSDDLSKIGTQVEVRSRLNIVNPKFCYYLWYRMLCERSSVNMQS